LYVLSLLSEQIKRPVISIQNEVICASYGVVFQCSQAFQVDPVPNVHVAGSLIADVHHKSHAAYHIPHADGVCSMQ
jgi:hypothetical protein